MAGEFAPQAIWDLFHAVQAQIPEAVMDGILGNPATHTYGYHRSLAWDDAYSTQHPDYSCVLPHDRTGNPDAASALDIGLPPDLMALCTQRLLAAAKEHDVRLIAVREFCGTLNGTDTFPWDLLTDTSEGVNSWDRSHLSHIHLSFYRASATDAAALLPVAEVLAGIPLGGHVALNDADAATVWNHKIVNPVSKQEATMAGFLLSDYLNTHTLLLESRAREAGLRAELDAVKAELDKLTPPPTP